MRLSGQYKAAKRRSAQFAGTRAGAAVKSRTCALRGVTPAGKEFGRNESPSTECCD
jgi:hypothetical protein